MPYFLKHYLFMMYPYSWIKITINIICYNFTTFIAPIQPFPTPISHPYHTPPTSPITPKIQTLINRCDGWTLLHSTPPSPSLHHHHHHHHHNHTTPLSTHHTTTTPPTSPHHHTTTITPHLYHHTTITTPPLHHNYRLNYYFIIIILSLYFILYRNYTNIFIYLYI